MNTTTRFSTTTNRRHRPRRRNMWLVPSPTQVPVPVPNTRVTGPVVPGPVLNLAAINGNLVARVVSGVEPQPPEAA